MAGERDSINPKEIIEQGPYGDVYKAMDSKENRVAAKQIDMSRHSLPNIAEDVDKLKQLNHLNIRKIHDINQDENVVGCSWNCVIMGT